MRLYPLLLLLLSLLVVCSASESKLQRKTLRKVKALKKSSTKSSNATQEQAKSASYHVPILVSAPSPHDIPPVSVEVRDGAHSPSDYHPIQPIHLVARPSHHQGDYVYQGPVAVPLDYPYGREQQASNDYEINNRVSPGEYYSESYHGDLSAIPGIPGQDYPTFVDLPHTGFKCMQHTSTPGFYADVETRCQMWHYCQPDGRHDKFLCPNGTIFDQMTRVCNWWFNVHCDSSLSHYDINFDLYHEPLRLSAATATHKAVDNSIAPPPNSFLSHLENFEARSEYAPPIQSAAASQPVHRYPAKMAPAPQVRHDSDTYVDSSNAHTLATPAVSHSHSKTTPLFAEAGHAFVKAADDDSPFGVYRARSVAKPSDLKLQDVDKQRLKKRKRISRRKLRKLKGKQDKEDDDIPTYREPKATPAARRYRVVRRRKVNKQYQ